MRARINLWIDRLRTGFWFLPSVMLVLAAMLALVLLYVDERVDPGIRASIAWAYSGGPQGARSLLSTVAGSMITAASVTFSLAAVALSIASQQYGSRVLRNFMRDRITQVLLGTFTSTFIYSVLVVRAIRGTDVSGGFVPAISVTVAIALSLISLILLIFFVHHISASIQASHILRVISDDLGAAIPRLFPASAGDPHEQDADPSPVAEGQRITVDETGYLQSIDADSLFTVARRQSAVIELTIRPGDHQVAGETVAWIRGARDLPEEELKTVKRALLFGGERTPAQDIRYQFQQLTEVVIRALSPGINDPYTAINGIDELASGLAQLARRPREASARQDEDGTMRLIVPAPRVAEVLDDTVGHIVVYGARDRFIVAGLRRVLDLIEPDLQREEERSALARLRAELERAGEPQG